MPEQIHDGWIVAPTTEIPKDIKENFEQIEQALKGLLGANYEPLLYCGSKVDGGVNHMLICKLTIVSNPPDHMARVGICQGEDGKFSAKFIDLFV